MFGRQATQLAVGRDGHPGGGEAPQIVNRSAPGRDNIDVHAEHPQHAPQGDQVVTGVEAERGGAEDIDAGAGRERLGRGVTPHQFGKQPIGGAGLGHAVGIGVKDHHIAADARRAGRDLQVLLEQNGGARGHHHDQVGVLAGLDLPEGFGEANGASGQVSAAHHAGGHGGEAGGTLQHGENRRHIIIALGCMEDGVDAAHRVGDPANAVVGGTLVHPVG